MGLFQAMSPYKPKRLVRNHKIVKTHYFQINLSPDKNVFPNKTYFQTKISHTNYGLSNEYFQINLRPEQDVFSDKSLTEQNMSFEQISRPNKRTYFRQNSDQTKYIFTQTHNLINMHF